MGLQFPGVLRVQLLDESGKYRLGQYAVKLQIHAPAKNPYSLVKVTDWNGKVSFSLQEVEELICREQTLFVMDYKSSLPECYEDVTLFVMSSEAVRRAIQARKLYQRVTGSTGEDVATLEQVENHTLLPTEKRVRLSVWAPEVTVEVIVAELHSV